MREPMAPNRVAGDGSWSPTAWPSPVRAERLSPKSIGSRGSICTRRSTMASILSCRQAILALAGEEGHEVKLLGLGRRHPSLCVNRPPALSRQFLPGAPAPLGPLVGSGAANLEPTQKQAPHLRPHRGDHFLACPFIARDRAKQF